MLLLIAFMIITLIVIMDYEIYCDEKEARQNIAASRKLNSVY